LEILCEEGQCLLDPDLFPSLLLNLLTNARRSMEGVGRISVSCALTEDGCTLTVSDTGRGIPPEALSHLTEAFYRVDKSRSRAQGGAGLGLTLCQAIVQLHGGSLTFVSTPDKGTTVTATLKGGRP
jgi:signal transduction histidine kinase